MISLEDFRRQGPEYEFSTTDLIKHELWVLEDTDSIAIQKHFKK